MARLGVNIDHVATVREARKTVEPDPVAAAVLVELAGADGIVCHLREDRRHIKDRDLKLLRQVVKTHLNLEMAATEEMVNIALQVLPDMVTIVPEKRQELTTEGGLDVVAHGDYLQEVISNLRAHNIVVSLFVDPDIHQIKAAAKVGADFIELHTGEYANAEDENKMMEELEKLDTMAVAASKLGLAVSAGHGLNYQNVVPVAQLDKIEELNIGHSIISRAVLVGLDRAVKEMVALIR
ncbi:pyridoxine 5'-phosphate synthase [candidate division KSB1 bacterium]|nr:MAG: pyridoxine 5'-phosphate synthase [candidate division KSB1 bacterium]RKY84591.1 MAG: pyridoxine 5'-phosphate synthase [candidate division KSB1 bacterium]RKY92520.1 MAG: pyridoxine 5'-phosphate synthase [candidate division KSB1 bacterium]HDI52469.1 pyridoxine 5'-phosphate synthase [Bacteroidota bacterium]